MSKKKTVKKYVLNDELLTFFGAGNNSLYTIKLVAIKLTKLCRFFSVALNYANQLPFCILITKHASDTERERGEERRGRIKTADT